MTGSLSIVVCIDIDPPVKPMEQKAEKKKRIQLQSVIEMLWNPYPWAHICPSIYLLNINSPRLRYFLLTGDQIKRGYSLRNLSSCSSTGSSASNWLGFFVWHGPARTPGYRNTLGEGWEEGDLIHWCLSQVPPISSHCRRISRSKWGIVVYRYVVVFPGKWKPWHPSDSHEYPDLSALAKLSLGRTGTGKYLFD